MNLDDLMTNENLQLWQKRLLQQIAKMDMAALELRFLAYTQRGTSFMVGFDPGNGDHAAACVAHWEKDVLHIDSLTRLNEEAYGKEPTLIIFDDLLPEPEWTESAEIVKAREQANRRTKEAKKPIPYYHGHKRRF